MILRIWRGLVAAERAEEYADLVRRTGVPGYREIAGNVAAQVVSRDLEDGRAEILALSWWLDLDAIRTFAGVDAEVACFYPEDDRYLVDREVRARHYEVER